MGKHTQGEWSAGVYQTTDTMIERLKAGPQSCVCLVENGEPGMVIALCGDAQDEQSQKDADLISAAPDLLAACEEVLDVVRESFRDAGYTNHRTEWVCPLCGSGYDHDDDCPVVKIERAVRVAVKGRQQAEEIEQQSDRFIRQLDKVGRP